MGRITVHTERCKGCELCIVNCPQEVLVLSAYRNDKGYSFAEVEREEECTACGLCYLVCPDVAIEVSADEAAKK